MPNVQVLQQILAYLIVIVQLKTSNRYNSVIYTVQMLDLSLVRLNLHIRTNTISD
jgi:hypothetical protein